MSTLLSAPPVTTNGTTCDKACAEATECAFCLEPMACEHADVSDGREPLESSCRGPVHEECHRLDCINPACWVDPDASWDSLHEL